LDVKVFGSEFYIDSHPLLESHLLDIRIRQTPNFGVDPVADADYIYFPAFPLAGSFRVFEGKRTSVPIYARFGSLEPTSFGAVEDPTAGIVVQVTTDNPGFNIWTEVGDAPFSLASAQNTVGVGPLNFIVGTISLRGSDTDMFLFRVEQDVVFHASAIALNDPSLTDNLFMQLFNQQGVQLGNPSGYPTLTPGLYKLGIYSGLDIQNPGATKYRIQLNGARFSSAPIPEPSSFVLLAAVSNVLAIPRQLRRLS
jgi:hypothetical protein